MAETRLIVFDWDGTLMDSIATIVACAQHSLRDIGRAEVDDARIRGVIGLRLDATADHVLPGADQQTQEAWVERYRHNWIHTYRELPILLSGARDAVEALDASGYWLAIATGKGRTGLDRDLDATGLRRFFGATRTINEARGKPDPQMLFDLMAELGTVPAETLMVGDTTFDLDMANNAGVKSIAVLTGSHDRETLESRKPVACLASAAELPLWLSRS
jgi:phosphoglycolate phosphatase